MHWFYTGLDEIVVNSEPYRQAWIARGASPGKLSILPRGVDIKLFDPARRDKEFWKSRGAKSGAFLILYVGRISKEKDLDVLVEVSQQFGRQHVQFAFVGDGPYLDELKKLMPNAIFTGYLTGESLAIAYASASVFVFPSTTDTYGNVVVEALASGLPCLVSNVGGPEALVRHGATGFVTKALDAKDIVHHLNRLHEDAELLKTMSRNAANSVTGMDWHAAAKQFFGTTSC